jgi:AcrR family transcriptional regulator
MPRAVKTARSYDSSRRQEQARQSRAAVLREARRRFLADGFASTTVGAIAEGADVSVETVYKAFGNKAGLLKAVFDVAAVGDDEPVPLAEREMVAAIKAEPDGREKLRIYCTAYIERAERMVPVNLLARDAAATDAAAAGVLEQLRRERLTGMTEFAQHLRAARVLRKGVTVDETRDVLWTYTSAEVWELLVMQRRWKPARFGRWLEQQLTAALLP